VLRRNWNFSGIYLSEKKKEKRKKEKFVSVRSTMKRNLFVGQIPYT
jgi:hypothetical protein